MRGIPQHMRWQQFDDGEDRNSKVTIDGEPCSSSNADPGRKVNGYSKGEDSASEKGED
jgi:hypothetical protein